MSRFIGVDLHKKMFTVSFYEADANKHNLRSFKLRDIETFKRELSKEDVVGVEMRIKEEIAAQVSSMANTRDKFVKMRTMLKNKIHGLLNANGIEPVQEELSSKKALWNVLKYDVPPMFKVELEVIVQQIENLNEGIKRLDKELEEQSKNLKGYENITSIKGIGKNSGAILLSTIGDIGNFSSEKKLAAYFGMVPRVNQSGEKERQGHITKHGCKLGRTTLVQCTLVAIRYSPYLGAFYAKIKAKKGSGKAIIAAAKKLLGIIYHTLKNNWVFLDFPKFVLKTDCAMKTSC
jgi:transposase